METPEQQLAGLSREQRRLVELWLRREPTESPEPTEPVESPSNHIPRRAAADPIPASFAQQRFWFLHQLEPHSSACNFRTVVRLLGQLDVTVLHRSLQAIVERHTVLRTTFRIEDDQLHQVIAPAVPLPLPLVDLGGLPPDERDVLVPRLSLQAAEQPFDLAQGPLVRARLLRLSADEHVLLLPMHHIIPMAGRKVSSCASWLRSTPPSPLARHHRCRSCRSSMLPMPLPGGIGSRHRCSTNRWRIGKRNWSRRHTRWTFRPTTRTHCGYPDWSESVSITTSSSWAVIR